MGGPGCGPPNSPACTDLSLQFACILGGTVPQQNGPFEANGGRGETWSILVREVPEVLASQDLILICTVQRQHQGMDRSGVRQVPEGGREQGKMEETGCKIICGAPTTLAVKG